MQNGKNHFNSVGQISISTKPAGGVWVAGAGVGCGGGNGRDGGGGGGTALVYFLLEALILNSANSTRPFRPENLVE